MKQLVLRNHLVRNIDKAINLELIRDEAAHPYCKDNGRLPVCPVNLFKIVLLGKKRAINRERN